jgi:hypothetical protein
LAVEIKKSDLREGGEHTLARTRTDIVKGECYEEKKGKGQKGRRKIDERTREGKENRTQKKCEGRERKQKQTETNGLFYL